MKPFVILKLPILLCGLGAALLLSPGCKAQSEIDPDHFEGANTAPLEKVTPVAFPETRQAPQKPRTAQARTVTSDSGHVQTTAARDLSTSPVAAEDKRKAATRKSKQQ